MYLPRHFAQHEPSTLAAFMQAHPLATWISQREGELQADVLPTLYQPRATTPGDAGSPWAGSQLLAHVARANPIWRALHGRSLLIVFHGPQAYISPTWYPSKAAHGKAVPTWNYQLVQVRGVVEVVEAREALRDLVTRLTTVHEAGREPPWAVSDAPADYTDKMLAAIVGLRLQVQSIEGKWKLGQNRAAEDVAGVIQGLSTEPATLTPAHALATALREASELRDAEG